MDKVILEVNSFADSMDRFKQAWKTGKAARVSRIGFATPELMWRVLTEKRWAILRVMTGAGPLGVRELARRVGRDVKGVHTDATALIHAGVIDRTDDGKLLFPYRHVEVRFTLDAAA
ncbi:MAG: DNA-binding protein [Proteobacteria bacterium]|nr:DNA-binding protein [Pseudomonadota bacterium]